MKSGFKRFVSLCTLLMTSTSAFAGAGWTDYVPVAELTPTIHGRFLVKLNVTENPSGCKEEKMFYRDYGPGSEHMFRVFLEAVASGNKVRVYVTGICDINGYSQISSVTIVP